MIYEVRSLLPLPDSKSCLPLQEVLMLIFAGPLIVHDPNDPYKGQFDEEIILTTLDWYHQEIPTLIQQLLNTSNTQFAPPIRDALLLNDI
jgi:FtsP/CotA-like multicopper oxidase with cupredoxin domain